MPPRGIGSRSFGGGGGGLGGLGLPRGTRYLLIALAVLSIGTAAAGAWHLDALADLLALNLPFRGVDLLHGKLWQVATYTLFAPEPYSLILSGFVLWMVGASLERRWGTRRFLTFYFSAVALAAVLTTLLGLALPSVSRFAYAGTWTAVEALCAAYAVGYPEEQFLFMFVLPLRAKYLIHASLGMTLLLVVMTGQVVPYICTLFGLLAGVMLMSRVLRPRQLLLRMRVWWIDRKLKARKLRVIRGLPDDDELPQRRSGSRGSDGFLH